MRIRSITVSGLHPYRTPQTVDLDALQGPLVAVTGPNGAGKSTLLELALSAFYRRPPTRGKLTTLAVDRDAYIEVAAQVTGRELVFRHLIDGIGNKAEAFVTTGEGAPVDPRLSSGKVSAFDAWVTENLPAEEVALASLFSAQTATGFLGAKPSERKAILLRALGIDRIERLADAARKRVREIEKGLAVLDARVQETEPRTVVDRDARTKAEAHRDAQRQELASAEGALADVLERVRAEMLAAPIRERRADIRRRIEAVAARRVNGETWIEAAHARIASLPTPPSPAAITCAKAAHDHASKLAAEAHAVWSETAAQSAVDHREAARLGKEAADAFMAVLKAEQDIERARAAVTHDEVKIERMRERVEVLHALVKDLEASLEAAREVRVAGAEERIAGLRGGLEAIRDFETNIRTLIDADLVEIDPNANHTKALVGEARNTLVCDDALATAAETAPEHVRALTAEIDTTRQELRGLLPQLATAERALAHYTTLRDTLDIDALQVRETAVRTERDAAEQRCQATKSADYRAKRDAEQLTRTRDGIGDELARLQQRAMDAAQVESECARLVDAEARLAEIVTEHDALTAELAAIPEPAPWQNRHLSPSQLSPSQLSPRDLEAEARRAVDVARRDLTAAEAAVATLEASARAAAEAMVRLEELLAARTEVTIRLVDARKLAADLGRDGLQAMELDAAGPELSTLATELLHTAFGPRWTVSFETLRSSADGKREIETLEVRVLDTHTGYEGPVEALSGGERAIVGEAVSLALTVLACRGAGLEAPTLVRDESGAALDPEKSEAYVRMLRVAAELVGASRVLFVSHDARAAELADSRIEIADGVITVGGGRGGARRHGDVGGAGGVGAESEAA